MKISLADMIACVERELELRKRVYPRRVEAKKMTQEAADKEMLRMQAVRQTLLRIEKLYEGIDTGEKK
jgi:hypothetical protein